MTAKLAFIQRLALPRDFLSVTGKAWVDQIVRRVAGEKASEMRRHVPARQLGLYAVYLMAREAQLTDAMVDLLIETVHKIGSLETQGGGRYRERSSGSMARSDSWSRLPALRSTIHPGASAMSFSQSPARTNWRRSSRKARQKRAPWIGRIYKVMRRSWANHYRRMLPSLLSALEFRSNNAVWRPVLAALDWIRSKVDDGCRYVPPHAVPGRRGHSGEMAQFRH
ncbi:hypothetical protein [Novosphingobium sp.]|uniref:hypothetical protein n=1 Tax=Novosphingobium sp. TaxID=1874826 RepID=UPI0025F8BA20|nr:hypothetical protein [Novosphingobium sp.]